MHRHAITLDHDVLRGLVAEGVIELARRIAKASDNLVPNLSMDIVEWIEGGEDKEKSPPHIFIPTKVSERSGPMVLTPVQRIIARKLQRLGIKRLTFLKTPRMGSTLFMAALLLYFAVHEGVDVLYYERTDDDAQAFNDKKLMPLMYVGRVGAAIPYLTANPESK